MRQEHARRHRELEQQLWQQSKDEQQRIRDMFAQQVCLAVKPLLRSCYGSDAYQPRSALVAP
jgi:hypothetical protein